MKIKQDKAIWDFGKKKTNNHKILITTKGSKEMALRFYNTLTRQKEDFKPTKKGEVSLYTCGPTIYNYIHIGNCRTFLFEDILVRHLLLKGYKVHQIMNLTDVDDKTIKGSIKEDKSLRDFTDKYADAFFEDLKTLNITLAEKYPRATDHIDDMVDLIKKLLDKGYAYEAGNSIYYRISNFKDYGQLARIDKEKLLAGGSGRVKSDEYEKEQISDFALWKGYDEIDGNVFWETELGKGRPGWHIECSAMSMRYLGETFDIHTGGVDNIFPHHDNEIAQSEGASGKKFVNYWMHSEHLILDSKKMAKSEGNIYTVRQLLEKGFSKEAIRLSLISAHYRAKLNFSFDLITQSQASIDRLNNFINNLNKVSKDKPSSDELNKITSEASKKFEEFLDDDLNISGAIGSVFELVKEFNTKFDEVGGENAQNALEFLKKADSILGVMNFKEEILDEDIQKLIEERNEARKTKNFKRADEIRDMLKEQGIILKDSKDGTIWQKV